MKRKEVGREHQRQSGKCGSPVVEQADAEIDVETNCADPVVQEYEKVISKICVLEHYKDSEKRIKHTGLSFSKKRIPAKDSLSP